MANLHTSMPLTGKAPLSRLCASLSRTFLLAYMSPQDIDAVAHDRNLFSSAFRTMSQRRSPELLSKRLAVAGFSENPLVAAMETYRAI
ncbi:hypothetical protein [Bradyrhizobium vignae]|uniref:hypothetical protein n=1 Tax=Bradyrhizobium vignae TaxID=1549949 RepID=UPI0011AE2A4A|nr:hypothetical protein [Bradyrhizobium vignae]